MLGPGVVAAVIAHVAFAILAPPAASAATATAAAASISLRTIAVMALAVVRTLPLAVAQRLIAVVSAMEARRGLLAGILAGGRLGAVRPGRFAMRAFSAHRRAVVMLAALAIAAATP